MHIIFLDIDGVLNSYVAKHHATDILPECVSWLNVILEKAPVNTQVVLSSSWRLHFLLEDVEESLRKAGFQGSLVSMTPYLTLGSHLESRWPPHVKKFNPSQYGFPPPRGMSDYSYPSRALEIQAWLMDTHPSNPIESFVILDDLGNWGWLQSRVVMTDPDKGLQEANVPDVLKILQTPVNPNFIQPPSREHLYVI